MIISISNNGKATLVKEIELSKGDEVWTYEVYTKELNPFGILSVQGNTCFYLTHKKLAPNDDYQWTVIRFYPENDEEKQLLRDRSICLDSGKTWHPKLGRYSQRIYCIALNETRESLSFENVESF